MITAILTAIVDRYSLRKGQRRFTGQCPKCGGSKDTDRFVIRDDGGFKCYSCGWRGDIITYLREIDGHTCPEAHDVAGLPCRADSCPVRGTCRLGDGSGRRTTPRTAALHPPRPHAASELPTIAEEGPSALWSAWASPLVEQAAATLANCPDVLQWLEARGIDRAAACRYRLGWLGHDIRIMRAAVGLPPRADGNLKLWVPGGLVIPIFDAAGNIHRIRIRRTQEAREKFLPGLKYVWISGSGNAAMLLAPATQPRGAVIVEAELDAIAVASAHQQVISISIGSVAAGLTASQHAAIAAVPAILVALDADTDKDGKPGAGPDNVKRWMQRYRQAQYWPVPSAKDPGDYAIAGGNLRAWVEAGLIPEIVSSHDKSFAPLSSKIGEEGELNISAEPAPKKVTTAPPETSHSRGPKHYIMPLPDGREIHVTDDEPTWRELIAAGHIAFSENELLRLKAATARLDDSERLAAAMAAVDVKAVFGAAYIRRGEDITA